MVDDQQHFSWECHSGGNTPPQAARVVSLPTGKQERQTYYELTSWGLIRGSERGLRAARLIEQLRVADEPARLTLVANATQLSPSHAREWLLGLGWLRAVIRRQCHMCREVVDADDGATVLGAGGAATWCCLECAVK